MLSQSGNKRNPTLTQAELNGVMASHERYVLGRGGLRAQLGHKVLDGLNLANRNLMEADFAGASLVEPICSAPTSSAPASTARICATAICALRTSRAPISEGPRSAARNWDARTWTMPISARRR